MPLLDLCKLTAGLSRAWAGYLRDWDRSLRAGNYGSHFCAPGMVIMTGVVTSPVIPPVTFADRPGRSNRGSSSVAGGRGPLPLPRLAAVPARCRVYGLVTLEGSGWVAENTVVCALGWVPGLRLDIRESGGLVLVTADPQGVFNVTGRGHLRLPAAVRHWCGLVAGDRVLLAADPARGLLVVHPPAAVEAMVTQFHAGVLGGDGA